MTVTGRLSAYFLAILGGVIGGTIGNFIIIYATKQGLYPMVLPERS